MSFNYFSNYKYLTEFPLAAHNICTCSLITAQGSLEHGNSHIPISFWSNKQAKVLQVYTGGCKLVPLTFHVK